MGNVLLGKQLKKLRNENGMTQQEVSDLLCMKNKSTLASWEGGKSEPDAATFLELCKIYKVTDILKEFTGSSFDMKISWNEKTLIEKYRAIAEHSPHSKEIIDFIMEKEYDRCTARAGSLQGTENTVCYSVIPFRCSEQPASAGKGTYLGPESFTELNVIKNELTSRAAFGVPVSGDSMEPEYYDGDILIVEKTEELELGEIGIFTLGNEGYVKKLGDGELISLNHIYQPIPLDDSIILNGRVIGVLDPDWIAE